jgi:hypothetical protein
MVNYYNGKIYTIRYKKDDKLIYVGSTIQTLYKRFIKHIYDSKYPKNANRPLYKKMNGTDINDWYIELFEECACEKKEQLLQREGQIIREIGTLNKNIPINISINIPSTCNDGNKVQIIDSIKATYNKGYNKIFERELNDGIILWINVRASTRLKYKLKFENNKYVSEI